MCGVCGCNEHMSRFDPSVKNVCPACGKQGESVAHVAGCNDQGREEMSLSSVDDVVRWMESSETDPKVAELKEAHIRARGSCTMSDLLGENTPVPYSLLAQ